MSVRRFRPLREAGASYAEIAAECGCDWRTVKKSLTEPGVAVPPRAPSRSGAQPQLVAPFTPVIDAWLRQDLSLRGSVIHERLVAEYGFTGHYQRVVRSRPRIAEELLVGDPNRLTGLHRRFEVVAGAPAARARGDRGGLLLPYDVVVLA